MKRYVCVMMIAALLFAGCKKKEDPTANNKVGIMNEMVRYIDPTRVEISGTYSYLTSLDAIYVLVGTSNDMSDAMAFESVLSGKSFTVDVMGLKEYTNYYYRYRFVSMGTEQEPETVRSLNGDHEYVDLDLPSGLLWATCNVGADSPEDYGWYFMWGSVTEGGDPNCSWAKCPGNGGSSDYNATAFYTWKAANLTGGVLNPDVDAATANWGWRMPTTEEWQELYDNTTSTWTIENGVYGRKFTSKADSSKYIFLPAAGYRNGTSLNNAGFGGLYWSSSLYSSNPIYAYYVSFYSGYVYPQNGSSRCIGFTVRPVR